MGSLRKLAFHGCAVLAVVLATALLLEAAVQVAVRAGILETPRPSYADGRFWDGEHAKLGVWHRPGSAVAHHTDCFTVTYRTNSVGARDAERTPAATGSRVVVLGDSFVEGWGIAAGRRITDLLEAETGLEHLNFGMSHFGPYQEYLAYRELALAFEHDLVLIGIVPFNDFFDLDIEMARNAPSYEYRYRPYLTGEYPDLVRRDLKPPPGQGLLRRYSYAYNAFEHAYFRARADEGLGAAPPGRDRDGLYHSYFYDFSDRQFNLLRFSLERLLEAAGDRRVGVFLIPTRRDFVRFYQSGASTLSRRLQKLESLRSAVVVDLLAAMYAYPADPDQYYFPCDYHLSELGNRIAADRLHQQLGDGFYGASGRRRGPAAGDRE